MPIAGHGDGDGLGFVAHVDVECMPADAGSAEREGDSELFLEVGCRGGVLRELGLECVDLGFVGFVRLVAGDG